MSHVILCSVLAVPYVNLWLRAVPYPVTVDNNASGTQYSAKASIERVNSKAG